MLRWWKKEGIPTGPEPGVARAREGPSLIPAASLLATVVTATRLGELKNKNPSTRGGATHTETTLAKGVYGLGSPRQRAGVIGIGKKNWGVYRGRIRGGSRGGLSIKKNREKKKDRQILIDEKRSAFKEGGFLRPALENLKVENFLHGGGGKWFREREKG